MRITRTITITGLAGAALVVGAVQASAHPGPPPHDHFIVVDGVQHQIGPQVCGVDLEAPQNAGLHSAFHAFHSNVHRGAPNQAFTSGDDHSHVDGIAFKIC